MIAKVKSEVVISEEIAFLRCQNKVFTLNTLFDGVEELPVNSELSVQPCQCDSVFILMHQRALCVLQGHFKSEMLIIPDSKHSKFIC